MGVPPLLGVPVEALIEEFRRDPAEFTRLHPFDWLTCQKDQLAQSDSEDSTRPFLGYTLDRALDGVSVCYELRPDRTFLFELSVGRDPGNEICVPNETLSKRHFVLLQRGSGWRLRDSGSRNGTRVEGALVEGELLLG